MTVSSTVRITTPFIGTGILVPTFGFGFKVFVNTDILAVITYLGVQTTLALTSDYSVTLNSDQDGSPGGTITLNTLSNTPGIVGGILAVGATMIISSQVPQLQSNTLTNFGGFFPTVINAMVDRLTILVQQLALTIGRGITFPITDSNTLTTQLPPAAARANQALLFDNVGNVTVGAIATAPVSVAMQPVVAANTLALARTAMGLDTTYLKSASNLSDLANSTTALTNLGAGYLFTPQGRLTLTAGTPVMNANTTGASTIYYVPYAGQNVPVYNGTAFVPVSMGAGLSLALDSNAAHTGYQQSANIFDIFAFMNGGVLTLGTGPAWASSSARANAISQVGGIWVNSAIMTMKIDATATTVNVAANQATYLGSMYATGNGQTNMAFTPNATTGGSSSTLGLYNAYNRVNYTTASYDLTSSWTYTTASFRPTNNSTSNRVNWLDGLGQSPIDAACGCVGTQSGAVQSIIAIGVNSTTTAASNYASMSSQTNPAQTTAIARRSPILGFNYVQALEYASGATATYFGSGSYQYITLNMSM